MKLKINNCDWVFKCPQNWENLEKTASSKVKFCNECQKNVFLCSDESEIDYHASRLNCIYIETFEQMIESDVMGRYLPSEYQGATMKISLNPTFSLDQEQIKFLVRSFDLGKFEHNWKEILCDGKMHVLKTKIPPDMAESLVKRLEDRNIAYSLEVEPD